jgi:hypothetical protein
MSQNLTVDFLFRVNLNSLREYFELPLTFWKVFEKRVLYSVERGSCVEVWIMSNGAWKSVFCRIWTSKAKMTAVHEHHSM